MRAGGLFYFFFDDFLIDNPNIYAKSPTLRIKAKGVFFLPREGESIFVGKQVLKINMLQMPKIEDSGIVEIADWIACYVAVSMQNGVSLRS